MSTAEDYSNDNVSNISNTTEQVLRQPANLQPFLLENYFAKHEFSAKYLMSSSDAQSMSMKELLSYATPEQVTITSLKLHDLKFDYFTIYYKHL